MVISSPARNFFGVLTLFLRDGSFSYVSLSCAVLTLYCRILAYNGAAAVHDWTAVLDTSDFNVKICFYFIIIVLTLNLIAHKKNKK